MRESFFPLAGNPNGMGLNKHHPPKKTRSDLWLFLAICQERLESQRIGLWLND